MRDFACFISLMKVCVHQVSSALKMLHLSVIVTSSPLLKANPNPNRLGENCIRSLGTDFLLNSASSWEDKLISAQAFIRYVEEVKLKEKSPDETSPCCRVKKLMTLQKSNHISETTQQSCNKPLWEPQNQQSSYIPPSPS